MIIAAKDRRNRQGGIALNKADIFTSLSNDTRRRVGEAVADFAMIRPSDTICGRQGAKTPAFLAALGVAPCSSKAFHPEGLHARPYGGRARSFPPGGLLPLSRRAAAHHQISHLLHNPLPQRGFPLQFLRQHEAWHSVQYGSKRGRPSARARPSPR